MEHIWQEMAKDILFVYGDLINMTEDKFSEVLGEAWGDDRDASVWTVDDVLQAAEDYHDIADMTVEDARAIFRQLVVDISGCDGYDSLDYLIREWQGELDDGTDY